MLEAAVLVCFLYNGSLTIIDRPLHYHPLLMTNQHLLASSKSRVRPNCVGGSWVAPGIPQLDPTLAAAPGLPTSDRSPCKTLGLRPEELST